MSQDSCLHSLIDLTKRLLFVKFDDRYSRYLYLTCSSPLLIRFVSDSYRISAHQFFSSYLHFQFSRVTDLKIVSHLLVDLGVIPVLGRLEIFHTIILNKRRIFVPFRDLSKFVSSLSQLMYNKYNIRETDVTSVTKHSVQCVDVHLVSSSIISLSPSLLTTEL